MKQVAIVTGSATGFGRLIANTLAASNVLVYAAMRNTSAANKEAADKLSVTQNIKVTEFDATSEASVQKTVQLILSEQGRIDFLINNAGGSSIGIVESHSSSDLKKLFDVNFFGPFYTIKSVLPAMRRQKAGLIINISSGLGRINLPFFGAYAATKHALESISETLRYELSQTGVEITLVEPGAFPSTGLLANTKSYGPSETGVALEYGELFSGFSEGFIQFQNQIVQAGQSPDPQMVADAVKGLVNTEQGKRPLRMVVDPMNQATFESLNNYTDEIHKATLGAMRLQHLYK